MSISEPWVAIVKLLVLIWLIAGYGNRTIAVVH